MFDKTKTIFFSITTTIMFLFLVIVFMVWGYIVKNDMLLGIGLGLIPTTLSTFIQAYIATRVDYLLAIEESKTENK